VSEQVGAFELRHDFDYPFIRENAAWRSVVSAYVSEATYTKIKEVL
jgi:hypothetical protein